MNKTWLILDCNYLCHRARHSTGDLSYEGSPTGVIYGFLKSISYFQERFDTPHVVFCWDSKTNKRYDIFPKYKANRKRSDDEFTEEQIEFENAFRMQMVKLRRFYLKAIGYKNVFVQKGYESDDIIASVCQKLPHQDKAIIISSDKDLYQLIRDNISMHNPQKGTTVTLQSFRKEYGFLPHEWKMVKCLAGCSTDGVPGIPRVGEKTAIKYILGNLKDTTKAFADIVSKKGMKIYKRNWKLVVLPMKGTKVFELQEDKISKKGWRKVTAALGMKSIKDRPPIYK